jgi:hypothetical protein
LSLNAEDEISIVLPPETFSIKINKKAARQSNVVFKVTIDPTSFLE